MMEHEQRTLGGTVWFEDGIMRLRLLGCSDYTLEQAKDDARALRELGTRINGRRLLAVEPGRMLRMSLPARRYQAANTPEIAEKVAYVFDNPVSRVVVSFSLGLGRTPVAVGMFDDLVQAIVWLREG